VLEEQEAREKRRQSRYAQRASLVPSMHQADGSHSPPPPTAFPTRPISQMPDFDSSRPRSIVIKRNSTYNHENLAPTIRSQNAKVQSEFGPPLITSLDSFEQATQMIAKKFQRPSTSWHVERLNQVFVPEEEEIGVAISMRLERPKSMSYLSSGDSSPVITKTEIPMLPRRNSTRRANTTSQLCHVINQESINTNIPPISHLDSSHNSSPILPHSSSFNGTAGTMSGYSSATTAFDHSTSHSTSSKSDRRSWHPKTLLSKLKDFNMSSERLGAKSTALQNFAFDIPPISESQRASLAHRSHSESPGLVRKKSSQAFEPFVFSDHHHRFSETSDISTPELTHSLSRPRLSDLDSGLGMSDTETNFGLGNTSTDSIPTLRPGAEKRYTKMDSSQPRNSHIGSAILLGPTGSSSPAKSFTESHVRHEHIFDGSMFDSQNGLQLQFDPPEDEGIFVGSPSPEQQAPVKNETAYDIIEPPVIQTGPAAADRTSQQQARKRTRSIISFRRTFARSIHSHKRSNSSQSVNPAEIAPPAPTAQSTRPSSRSQPILAGFDTNEPVPKIPSTVQIPVEDRKPRERRSSMGTGLLAVSAPPIIPQNEMQFLNPQCLALLRAQEMLLARRSIMDLTQESEKKIDIGMAVPFDEDRSTLVSRDGNFGSKLGVSQTMGARRRSSNPFAKEIGRSMPNETMSMTDLNRLVGAGGAQKKKGWWKSWKA
jgi:hypothetical protein